MYLTLPRGIRDRWLDVGAPDRLPDLTDRFQYDAAAILSQIAALGLGELLRTDDVGAFRQSLLLAAKIVFWLLERPKRAQEAARYLHPVMHDLLPVDVLFSLPFRRSAETYEICLNPEDWSKVLAVALQRAGSPKFICSYLDESLNAQLLELAIDPRTVFLEHGIADLEEIASGPDYIRQAEWLTIGEKLELLHAPCRHEKAADEARRIVVERFRVARATDDAEPLPESLTVEGLYRRESHRLSRKYELDGQRAVLQTRQGMITKAISALGQQEPLACLQLGGQPALAALGAALKTCDDLVLSFIAALALRWADHHFEHVGEVWQQLAEIHNEEPLVESQGAPESEIGRP